MEAKGHGKDSLANKILESNAQIHFQNSRVEDIYSDEDEMYIPDEEEESEKEQHEEEDEDDSNVLEQPTSKKLPKTMSSFVAKHVNQPRKEVATIVSPMTRSGSMAESLKQVAQSQQKQKAHNFEHKKQQQQPTSKKNGLQSQKVQQTKEILHPLGRCHRLEYQNLKHNLGTMALRKERYIVAEEGRKCILEIVGARWRGYKCWVKKHHFYAYETYEKRWEKRPQTIPDAQFKDLLDYWDFELVKELSNKNKSNRLKADDMHTLGPNSYALLRHELQQEDPNKEPPSQAKVYIKSRTRNPKRKYKTSYQQTKQNMFSRNASTAKPSVGGPSSVAADSLHQLIGSALC
ncbi:DNA replication and repair protein RecF [Bienertia sinuspersici]